MVISFVENFFGLTRPETWLLIERIILGARNESEALSKEDLRQMPNHSSQRRITRYLRQS